LGHLFERMSRPQKRVVLVLLDTMLIALSLLGAVMLRYGSFFPTEAFIDAALWFPLVTLLGGAFSWLARLPHYKLSAFDNSAILRVAYASLALVASASICGHLFGLNSAGSVPVIAGSTFFLSVILSRVLAQKFVAYSVSRHKKRVPVAIYGSGLAAVQLATALREDSEVKPVAFVDHNPTLRGVLIAGMQVHSVADLSKLAARHGIKRLLISVPDLPGTTQQAIADSIRGLGIDTQVLPSYAELLASKDISKGLRPVAPNDLLGRSAVDLAGPEIAKAYAGRAVMVTGTGGSIGTELCRQIMQCRPRHLVLFEQSEFALYKIQQELAPIAELAGVALTARLGSVTDAGLVRTVLAEQNVEIVLHAAAYKHVPLVEENEVEGARNNVIGTRVVAEACDAMGIERFILVSTDKAVRPTTIMGATKRMAELVVQDLHTRSTDTRYAIVRFGNVLGSSGSVLPLFQKQIEAGGPVTVTHKDVERYFMTISEASRLVLLAGAFADGGDVFVLDMGKPMRILDIARRMIELSGNTVRENGETSGIEIKVTGLRPAEKMSEELFLDDANLVDTPHPKISLAHEEMLSEIAVSRILRELRLAIERSDPMAVRQTIENRLSEYQGEQKNTA